MNAEGRLAWSAAAKLQPSAAEGGVHLMSEWYPETPPPAIGDTQSPASASRLFWPPECQLPNERQLIGSRSAISHELLPVLGPLSPLYQQVTLMNAFLCGGVCDACNVARLEVFPRTVTGCSLRAGWDCPPPDGCSSAAGPLPPKAWRRGLPPAVAGFVGQHCDS